ncbi:ABC transporter substrate-binding protein [Segnochrobactrum spirostomi]|uniref:ABC transporter substrate-binding protein n=1 Tax=Segnochrobactrum spirostomi TaxID=2608987 RepID=A0A6A7Y739_9HYPH|nr:ABC transporter substrate-binding protein [Segnochrobactrum spirostomi]MQT15083.1 ABC transporter substrate-binding protein [Segnochrobactrum spirostomi]
MIELDRRSVLAALAGLGLGPARAAESGRRIAVLDYGLAQTMLALGVAPIAIAEAGEWLKWVGAPPLPAEIVDLGTDREINLEVLAAVKPDLVLSTPYLEQLTALIAPIAPVVSLPIYSDARAPLRLSVEAARRIGAITDRADAAVRLVAEADAKFAVLRSRFAARPQAPLLLVNFVDERHLRVYGGASLYQDVLDRVGLANAWARPTNDWGFATIGLEALADFPEARLIVFEPIGPDIRAVLARGPLWSRLPLVKAGRVSIVPTVLMFGTLPSATRFADILDATLPEAAG